VVLTSELDWQWVELHCVSCSGSTQMVLRASSCFLLSLVLHDAERVSLLAVLGFIYTACAVLVRGSQVCHCS
jgi:hypothetical protein